MSEMLSLSHYILFTVDTILAFGNNFSNSSKSTKTGKVYSHLISKTEKKYDVMTFVRLSAMSTRLWPLGQGDCE